jgi:hypothetical protein
MDDFVDILTQEQNNPNGLLLEILESGYEEWDYLFAVEGKDDQSFYFDFIKMALPNKNCQFLDCGGKGALLAFKKAVDVYPWSDPPIFKFLCDKDFDDYISDKVDGVWYTDRYSIESYLVDRAFIEYNIAKRSMKPISMRDRECFLDEYQKTFERLTYHVRSYCALMCEIRANGEHPLFDDFGIDNLFDLSNQSLPVPHPDFWTRDCIMRRA